MGIVTSIADKKISGVTGPVAASIVPHRANSPIAGEVMPMASAASPTALITLPSAQQTVVLVKGIDKQVVGEVAAKVRSIRPPEPYKGKGIRYAGEYVQRKVGKRA